MDEATETLPAVTLTEEKIDPTDGPTQPNSTHSQKKRSLSEYEGMNGSSTAETTADNRFKRARTGGLTNGVAPGSTEFEEEGEKMKELNGIVNKGAQEDGAEVESDSGSEEGEILEDEDVTMASHASLEEASATNLVSSQPEGGTVEEQSLSLEDAEPNDSEESDAEAADNSRSGSPSSTVSVSAPQTSGWNRGITSGQVRISLGFTPKPTTSLSPAPAPELSAPATEEQDSAPGTNQPSSQDVPCHTLPNSKISLRLPKLDDSKRHDTWKFRFKDWANSLKTLNPEKTPLSKQITLEAYTYYIDRVSNLNNKKRKPAKQAAKAVLHVSDSTETPNTINKASGPASTIADGNMGPITSQARTPSGDQRQVSGLPTVADKEGAQEGKSSITLQENARSEAQDKGVPVSGSIHTEFTMPIPTGDDELIQQARYFPGQNPASDMCVLCLQSGHTAMGCQASLCKYCEHKDQHTSSLCPTKKRCTICNELGHTRDECTEDEGGVWEEVTLLTCAFCNSTGHLDAHCDTLWRTFNHGNLPNKINSMLAFCARCGEEGHYISECPRNDGPSSFKTPTWSLETMGRCIDKSSQQGPISEFKSIPTAPSSSRYDLRRPELMGRAQNNILFESDDSDNDAVFLTGRVQPKQPAGRINLSTNIQFADAGNTSGGQQRSSQQLPQAPTGPASRQPPQGPAATGGRQVHQLPPRPQVPASASRRGRGGFTSFSSVAPPPGLCRNESQGSTGRNSSNGGGSRGGGRDKGPSRRGGRRGGGGGGGGPRGNRGRGGWA